MAAALFVIDIQNDLATDPSSKIPHASRIRSSGEKIISAARTALQAQKNNTAFRLKSIIFVQHEEGPENGTLVRGSDPWKLVFEPIPGEATERVVPKWTREF